MQSDQLTTLPAELLDNIIVHLDALSLLRCRQVHPRLAARVDQLPKYKKYRVKFFEFEKEHHKFTRMGAVQEGLTVEGAAILYDFVQEGLEVDYYFFFSILLRYPQMRAKYHAFGVLGANPG